MQPMKMTALYERISREDRNEGESFSILRQKEYLEAYAAANGLKQSAKPFFRNSKKSKQNWRS